MKTIKPTRQMLQRKIIVDDVGTAYVVGKLSKADLQILVCALDDDLREIRKEMEHYEQAYNGGKGL